MTAFAELESLEPAADFTTRVLTRVRRRVRSRQLILLAAGTIGAAFALSPALDLVRALTDVLPRVMSEFGIAVPMDQGLIVAGACAALISPFIVSLFESEL